jgi:hypothetical protein
VSTPPIGGPITLNADDTLSRGADTSALSVPYLSFRAERSSGGFFGSQNWRSGDHLLVEAAIGGGPWLPFIRLFRDEISTATTNNRINLALPFQNPDFRIRFNTDNLGGSRFVNIDDVLIASGQPYDPADPGNDLALQLAYRYTDDDGLIRRSDTAFRGPWCVFSDSSPVTAENGFHCLGPTIEQFAGGTIIIDTSGGPLSFYYTESPDDDERSGGTADVSLPPPLTTAADQAKRFLYLSRFGAELRHVDCGGINDSCLDPVDQLLAFTDPARPDRLNFFGRETDAQTTTDNIQNLRITTNFGQDTQIAGVWFYFPRGRVELRIDPPAEIPVGFYDPESWTFSGRLWVSQLKPYGAFHFRVPRAVIRNNDFGLGNAALFSNFSGTDWIARSVTSSRLW